MGVLGGRTVSKWVEARKNHRQTGECGKCNHCEKFTGGGGVTDKSKQRGGLRPLDLRKKRNGFVTKEERDLVAF